MKNLMTLLLVLQLTSCCLIDACSNDNKTEVTPVEASDKPLPSLESQGDTAKP